MGCKPVLWYAGTNDHSDVIYFNFFGDYQCSTLCADITSLAVSVCECAHAHAFNNCVCMCVFNNPACLPAKIYISLIISIYVK